MSTRHASHIHISHLSSALRSVEGGAVEDTAKKFESIKAEFLLLHAFISSTDKHDFEEHIDVIAKGLKLCALAKRPDTTQEDLAVLMRDQRLSQVIPPLMWVQCCETLDVIVSSTVQEVTHFVEALFPNPDQLLAFFGGKDSGCCKAALALSPAEQDRFLSKMSVFKNLVEMSSVKKLTNTLPLALLVFQCLLPAVQHCAKLRQNLDKWFANISLEELLKEDDPANVYNILDVSSTERQAALEAVNEALHSVDRLLEGDDFKNSRAASATMEEQPPKNLGWLSFEVMEKAKGELERFFSVLLGRVRLWFELPHKCRETSKEVMNHIGHRMEELSKNPSAVDWASEGKSLVVPESVQLSAVYNIFSAMIKEWCGLQLVISETTNNQGQQEAYAFDGPEWVAFKNQLSLTISIVELVDALQRNDETTLTQTQAAVKKREMPVPVPHFLMAAVDTKIQGHRAKHVRST